MDKTLNNLIRDFNNLIIQKSQEIRFSLLELCQDIDTTIETNDISREELISKLKNYKEDVYTIKNKIENFE